MRHGLRLGCDAFVLVYIDLRGWQCVFVLYLLDFKAFEMLLRHLHFVLMFWIKDESAEFEKTDEAIEKSVNLAFDLMGKGVVDNVFEFGKFLYQQAKG